MKNITTLRILSFIVNMIAFAYFVSDVISFIVLSLPIIINHLAGFERGIENYTKK